MRTGRPTVHDVARAAGVASSTVSNVLNHPERVDPPTAQRVLRAIDELGYVRNGAARDLRVGGSDMIGLVMLDSAFPFYWQLEHVIEQAVERRGYTTLVANSGLDPARELRHLRTLQRHRADGLIVTPTSADISALRAADAGGTPVVLVDYPRAVPSMSVISIDHFSAGRTAARHLLSGGRRHIAVVDLRPSTNFLVEERNRGAMSTADELTGVTFSSVKVGHPDFHGGEEVAAAILTRQPRPDALFAPNDVVAEGALEAFLHLGIKVPDDIAIVGYDDQGYPSPRASELTTMRQDSGQIGLAAADAIFARLEHAEPVTLHRVFSPRLIQRTTA
jgi:LacI family transcriptional regulator